MTHSIPTNGRDRNLAGTSWKSIEYYLHLIKIPSHVCVETMYNIRALFMSRVKKFSPSMQLRQSGMGLHPSHAYTWTWQKWRGKLQRRLEPEVVLTHVCVHDYNKYATLLGI